MPKFKLCTASLDSMELPCVSDTDMAIVVDLNCDSALKCVTMNQFNLSSGFASLGLITTSTSLLHTDRLPTGLSLWCVDSRHFSCSCTLTLKGAEGWWSVIWTWDFLWRVFRMAFKFRTHLRVLQGEIYSNILGEVRASASSPVFCSIWLWDSIKSWCDHVRWFGLDWVLFIDLKFKFRFVIVVGFLFFFPFHCFSLF